MMAGNGRPRKAKPSGSPGGETSTTRAGVTSTGTDATAIEGGALFRDERFTQHKAMKIHQGREVGKTAIFG